MRRTRGGEITRMRYDADASRRVCTAYVSEPSDAGSVATKTPSSVGWAANVCSPPAVSAATMTGASQASIPMPSIATRTSSDPDDRTTASPGMTRRLSVAGNHVARAVSITRSIT